MRLFELSSPVERLMISSATVGVAVMLKTAAEKNMRENLWKTAEPNIEKILIFGSLFAYETKRQWKQSFACASLVREKWRDEVYVVNQPTYPIPSGKSCI